MSDFEWTYDIPSPQELGEHYRKLKEEAANSQRYADAAKYRDLERECLGQPKFNEFEAWSNWFHEAKESGQLLEYLKGLRP